MTPDDQAPRQRMRGEEIDVDRALERIRDGKKRIQDSIDQLITDTESGAITWQPPASGFSTWRTPGWDFWRDPVSGGLILTSREIRVHAVGGFPAIAKSSRGLRALAKAIDEKKP